MRRWAIALLLVFAPGAQAQEGASAIARGAGIPGASEIRVDPDAGSIENALASLEALLAQNDALFLLVVCGDALEGERTQARESAQAGLALCSDLEDAVHGIISQLDAEDRFGEATGDRDRALDDALHLVRTTLPLRAARCAVALAATERGVLARQDGLRAVLDVLNDIDAPSEWAETERLCVSAEAVLVLERWDEAGVLFERAQVSVVPEFPEFYRRSVLRRCGAGLGLCAVERGRPDLARDILEGPELNSPELSVLATDLAWRIARAELAGVTGAERTVVLARAMGRAERAIASTRDAEIARSVREAVIARAARASDASWVLEQLPAIASLGAARRAEIGQGPRQRSEAILAGALARARKDGDPLLRDVEFALASTRLALGMLGPDVTDGGASLLLAVAERHPADDRARSAPLRAAAGAQEWAASHPGHSQWLCDVLERAAEAESDQRTRTQIVGVLAAELASAGDANAMERCLLLVAPADRARIGATSWAKAFDAHPERRDQSARQILRWFPEAGDAPDDLLVARLRAASHVGDDAGVIVTYATIRDTGIALDAPDSRRALEAAVRVREFEVANAILAGLRGEGVPIGEVLESVARPACAELMDARTAFPVTPSRSAQSSSAVVSWAREEAGRDATPALLRCDAWASLLDGHLADARAGFEAVLASQPQDAIALLGLGETLLAAGDDAGAFARFRALAEAERDPALPGRGALIAWTRMLEILSRQNTDGSRTAQIQREAARLLASQSISRCPECAERLRAMSGR